MIFVKDISPRIVAKGQMLSVFGGFFDSSVSVTIGGTECAVSEVSDDLLTVVVPIVYGENDVVIRQGSSEYRLGNVLVTELAKTPSRSPAKEYDDGDFSEYILSLMPRGVAFDLERDSNITKMLKSFALVVAYVWNSIRSMMDAIDPTRTENLDEWESELGLPEVGISPSNDDGRRSEIYRVECSEGGCSESYIKKILSLMDINAEVYEYTKNPEKFSAVDFGSEDPRYFFMVRFHVRSENFSTFTAGNSAAGDYLLDFTQHREESVFRKIKPSHTNIVFSYDDGIYRGELIDDTSDTFVDEDGVGIEYYENLFLEHRDFDLATNGGELLVTEVGDQMEIELWQ